MEALQRAAAPALAAALLLALAALAAAEGSGERLVAVVAVEDTVLKPGEESQPLTPLFKVACGNTTVVVYGPEQGRPLIIAVYHHGSGDWRSELPGCLPSLESCLTAAGAAEAYKRLAEMATAATVLRRALESSVDAEAATATAAATAAAATAQAEAGAAAAQPAAAARIAQSRSPTPSGAGAALLVLAAAATAWTVTMAWARRRL